MRREIGSCTSHFLVSKVSSAEFNIWIVTLINSYFVLLIIMMDQMSSDLYGVGIRLVVF